VVGAARPERWRWQKLTSTEFAVTGKSLNKDEL